MSARAKHLSTNNTKSECDNCRTKTRPGRGLLIGRVRLNAASDDFVICGCFNLFIRILQLLSLLLAFFIFDFRQDKVKILPFQSTFNTSNGSQKNESTMHCTLHYPISATLDASVSYTHLTLPTKA